MKTDAPLVKTTIHSASQRPTTTYLRTIWAVVWKDLAAELRSRELLSAMLVFALLVILIFNFALELDARTRYSVTAGVLWATFAFAGTLGSEPFYGDGKGPRLPGWPFAGAGGPQRHLFR